MTVETVLTALADPTRRQVLEALARELPVSRQMVGLTAGRPEGPRRTTRLSRSISVLRGHSRCSTPRNPVS